jgi:DNA-binding NtrC family response regulator
MTSEDIEALGEDEFFLSVSPAMRQLRAQAELLAQSDVPVLILGEPGSGKGTVARLIHQRSVHSGFKFLRVNCAEMPADLLEIELFGRENGSSNGSSKAVGKVEIGHKGTILLDEITGMPIALQSRILKVLQEKRLVRSGDTKPVEIDIRILAASSDKMDCALAEKRMHPDLYYRLSAFTVHVPALRHRREEIKVLLRYSMRKVAKHYGLRPRDFTSEALEACQNHFWTGNLKELETFVKRYLIAGDEELPLTERKASSGSGTPKFPLEPSTTAHVDPGRNSSSPQSLKSMVQSVRWATERNAIAAALEKTGWNRKAASRLLGVSYRTILSKIEQYEMSAPNSFLSGAGLTFSSQNKGTGKTS